MVLCGDEQITLCLVMFVLQYLSPVCKCDHEAQPVVNQVLESRPSPSMAQFLHEDSSRHLVVLIFCEWLMESTCVCEASIQQIEICRGSSSDLMTWCLLWCTFPAVGPFVERCDHNHSIEQIEQNWNASELNFKCPRKPYEYLCNVIILVVLFGIKFCFFIRHCGLWSVDWN